jgi:hypothetical protein
VRLTGQNRDEVGVVDVQIDGRTAGPSRVADRSRPVGPGDQAVKMPRAEIPESPISRYIKGERELGKKWQYMSHKQAATGSTRLSEHPIRVLERKRDRFFDEYVLPGA